MSLGKPIEFRDFAPDADTRIPGVIVDCDGLIATTRGYSTMPSSVPTGAILPDGLPSRGAYSTQVLSGYPMVFAGTDAHLYRLIGATWQQWYDGETHATEHWSFTTWGNAIFAVNGTNQPLLSMNGERFQVLANPLVPNGGEPPISCCVEAVPTGVFLVKRNSNEWWFSSSPTATWARDIANGVVSASIYSAPGSIVSVNQLTNGAAVFYKERSMHLAQYIGPPFFWSVTPVSEQVGCASPKGVISIHDAHFFLGPDDFYQFDGSSLQRIPNTLKEWFFRRIDSNAIAGVIGHYDPTQSLLFWHYSPVDVNPPGQISEWVSYNIRTQKWARGSLLIEDAVRPFMYLMMDELTYDQFEEHFPPNTPGEGSLYANVPNVRYDAFSTGTTVCSGYFSVDNELLTMTGPPAGGYLVTGEIGDGSSFWQLSAIRPVFARYPADRYVRADAFKTPAYGWPVPDDAPFPRWPTIGPTATLNRDGAMHLIQTARAHQVKLSFTGDMEIVGVQYDLIPVGTQ